MVLKSCFTSTESTSAGAAKFKRSENTRIRDAVQALALCHNVTPVYETSENCDTGIAIGEKSYDFFYNKEISGSITSETEADQHLQMPDKAVTYQASSPDEVALVQWTQEVGLTLSRRDLSSMQLRGPDGRLLNYAILQIFPFTSETKRMGIIVKVGLYDSNGIS